ncbi:exo-beta-N-acetylmuramidase NamZ family protein [Paenibacillus gansuensis]|uniref:Exo-beta-N-acetylmuramidase NamZ domain-containing protein n=1 Tax=Paenibacillus gansuensis TaxID=306542 RepID=A0ABW5PGM7_9BACL
MVYNGIDKIGQYAHLFKGKRLGLITTPTGVNREFRSTIDILNEKFHLTALFSPEHGVRGDQGAGAYVDSYLDPVTGVPVHSLYRKDSKRLTDEMLNDVDLVVYDIQDVGTRYYTFIYTMLHALEDCAGAGKEFVVLDRINPLGGAAVEGNVLKPGYQSFVGGYPLCMRYGLTAGEVACMVNDRMKWRAQLQIVRCQGWERTMLFPDTGLHWIMPSMGIPRFDTALVYPGTCLFEGTNLSEGRGTTAPFEMIGAPFLEAEKLAEEMNGKRLPGVVFRPVYFRPSFSKFQGELCSGVQLHVLDRQSIRPVETGVELLFTVKRNYEEFSFLPPVKDGSRPFIDLLAGDQILRDDGIDVPGLLEGFRAESREFALVKEQYHLY